MYDITKVAETIKSTAKQRGYTIKALLEKCSLGKDTINTMSRRGSWIQADSLAKIADCLDVSVDYLLGRADYPQSKTIVENTLNSNHTTVGAVGNSNSVTVNSVPLDPDFKIVYDIYNSLSNDMQIVMLNDIIYNYRVKPFKDALRDDNKNKH
ncbi:MAG: helix-turn-helix domain-containing protein [Lachnospiraceae bacterium]|nr:helix-turn-helix domain-containing protein [Lachnospiraceae bacterium]